MLKNVFSILFIIISLFLGLIFLIGIPNNLQLIIVAFSSGTGYSIGYAMGNIIFSIFLLIFAIWLFKLALKWLKPKKKITETINEIGKN